METSNKNKQLADIINEKTNKSPPADFNVSKGDLPDAAQKFISSIAKN